MRSYGLRNCFESVARGLTLDNIGNPWHWIGAPHEPALKTLGVFLVADEESVEARVVVVMGMVVVAATVVGVLVMVWAGQ